MSHPVIIIGATGGIGAALSRRLSAAGRPLHLIGRDQAKLAVLAAELGATSAVADVMDRAALDAAIKAPGSTASGLAYCVGSINLKPAARITEDEAIRDFRLNALGAFQSVQAALPALKASGDAGIVLFSTIAVAQGFANHAAIGMAKGAVEGLMLSLAAELAPKIRVNCVAPSLTKTPLAAALTSSEQMASAIAALHPIPRLGEADDAAAAAAFLLSPDASWITGQVIGVDGGRSALRTKG